MMDKIAIYAICCKLAITLMLLLATGILSYPLFLSDNGFTKQRESLMDKDNSTTGSIKDLKRACKSLQNRLNKVNRSSNNSEWLSPSFQLRTKQLTTCEEIVELSTNFRDLVNEMELMEYSSFGLLCSALFLVLISSIIQIAARTSYYKNSSKCIDISIVLVIGTIAVLVATCLLTYLGAFSCYDFSSTISRLKSNEREIQRNVASFNQLIATEEERLKFSLDWKKYDPQLNRNSFTRLEDCSSAYNTTLLGIDAGLGVIITSAFIAAIAFAVRIGTPSQGPPDPEVAPKDSQQSQEGQKQPEGPVDPSGSDVQQKEPTTDSLPSNGPDSSQHLQELTNNSPNNPNQN